MNKKIIKIDSDGGNAEIKKMMDQLALQEQKPTAYVKPWYECKLSGAGDEWNTGFCDADCRSCSYSDGYVGVNKKKYQFKKHLTEKQREDKDFKSYKEERIFTKLNEKEIDK